MIQLKNQSELDLQVQFKTFPDWKGFKLYLEI